MDELEEVVLHACRSNLLEPQWRLHGFPRVLVLDASERLAILGETTKEELGVIVACQREPWQRVLHVCLKPLAIGSCERLSSGAGRIVVERGRYVSVKLVKFCLVNAKIHHPFSIAEKLDFQRGIIGFQYGELVECQCQFRRAAGIEYNDVLAGMAELLGEHVVRAADVCYAIADVVAFKARAQPESEVAFGGSLVVAVDEYWMAVRKKLQESLYAIVCLPVIGLVDLENLLVHGHVVARDGERNYHLYVACLAKLRERVNLLAIQWAKYNVALCRAGLLYEVGYVGVYVHVPSVYVYVHALRAQRGRTP